MGELRAVPAHELGRTRTCKHPGCADDVQDPHANPTIRRGHYCPYHALRCVIAGIDFSTKAIDVVLLNDDTDHAEHHRFPLPPRTHALLRAIDVAQRLPTASWWEERQVQNVALEEPYGRHAHTAKALGVIAGAIIARLAPGNLAGRYDITTIPQDEWLRTFTGAQKLPRLSVARKEIVRARCIELGLRIHGEDARDALGIAWAVRALNDQAIKAAQAATA